MTLKAVTTSPVRVAEICLGQEVAVSGRLDVNTVAAVRVGLQDIMDRGVGDLLLHLADAEVHDATGLGVIVGAHHRARLAGRRLVLVDVSPRLDRLLRATRLHRVLTRAPGEGATTGLSRQAAVPLKAAASLTAVVPLKAVVPRKAVVPLTA